MRKKKHSGRALVIQLGRDEIHIAQTTLGAAMPQLQHTAVIPTPEGAVEDGAILRPEPLRTALQAALSAPELKRIRRAVFLLCSTQVVSEVVQIPPVSERRLGKVLEANSDLYFPVETQDYHMVWTPIGPAEGEYGQVELAVQLWAVPNSLLVRYYTLANECGLSLEAVDYAGCSVVSAAGASFSDGSSSPSLRQRAAGAAHMSIKLPKLGKKNQKDRKNGEEERRAQEERRRMAASAVLVHPENESRDASLYIAAEPEHLMMTFVRNGQIKLQRLLLRGGGTDELSEAQMVLEYYYTTGGGSREAELDIRLCGSLASDVGYVHDLEYTLGHPVKVWNIQPGPEWCLCTGAAQVALDFGLSAMNHPKHDRRRLQGEAWQYALVFGSGAVLTASLLVTFGSHAVWSATLDGLIAQQNSLEAQAAKNPGAQAAYTEYKDLFDAYSGDWDTVFSSLKTYNNNLVLLLEELETVLPQGVSVSTMAVGDAGVGIQFACEDKETAAYAIMALRNLQYAGLEGISSLNIGKLSEARDGKFANTGDDMLKIITGEDTSDETDGTDQTDSSSDTGDASAEGSNSAQAALDAVQDATSELPPTKGSRYAWDELAMIWQQAALESGATTYEEATQYLLDKGIFTDDDLEEAMDGLTLEQLEALENSYGKTPSTTYSINDVLWYATSEERTAGLSTMLLTDSVAVGQFYQVLREDIERPAGTAILFDSISGDLMRQVDLFGGIMSGELSSLDEVTPELLTILTRDKETLAATQTLIQTNEKLSGRLAYYIAVAKGWIEADPDAAKLDTRAILNDIMSGTLPETADEEGVLESALNHISSNLLPSADSSGNGNQSMQDFLNQLNGNGSTGLSTEELQKLLQQYGGGQTSQTGGQQTTEDTGPDYYIFGAALSYKVDLLNAELNRKGLNAGDKLNELVPEGETGTAS